MSDAIYFNLPKVSPLDSRAFGASLLTLLKTKAGKAWKAGRKKATIAL
jgi:hypothetical protein